VVSSTDETDVYLPHHVRHVRRCGSACFAPELAAERFLDLLRRVFIVLCEILGRPRSHPLLALTATRVRIYNYLINSSIYERRLTIEATRLTINVCKVVNRRTI
jgi:hypothetical protein